MDYFQSRESKTPKPNEKMFFHPTKSPVKLPLPQTPFPFPSKPLKPRFLSQNDGVIAGVIT